MEMTLTAVRNSAESLSGASRELSTTAKHMSQSAASEITDIATEYVSQAEMAGNLLDAILLSSKKNIGTGR